MVRVKTESGGKAREGKGAFGSYHGDDLPISYFWVSRFTPPAREQVAWLGHVSDLTLRQSADMACWAVPVRF